MLERIWKNWITHTCWWECKIAFYPGKVCLLTEWSIQLPYDLATALLGIYLRKMKIYAQHKSMYVKVYSSFTYNNQKLERSQMSFNGWMIVIYSYHRLQFSNEKKQTIGMHNNLDNWAKN